MADRGSSRLGKLLETAKAGGSFLHTTAVAAKKAAKSMGEVSKAMGSLHDDITDAMTYAAHSTTTKMKRATMVTEARNQMVAVGMDEFEIDAVVRAATNAHKLMASPLPPDEHFKQHVDRAIRNWIQIVFTFDSTPVVPPEHARCRSVYVHRTAEPGPGFFDDVKVGMPLPPEWDGTPDKPLETIRSPSTGLPIEGTFGGVIRTDPTLPKDRMIVKGRVEPIMVKPFTLGDEAKLVMPKTRLYSPVKAEIVVAKSVKHTLNADGTWNREVELGRADDDIIHRDDSWESLEIKGKRLVTVSWMISDGSEKT